MSRHKISFNCSSSVATSVWCCDFTVHCTGLILSRLLHDVATSLSTSSSIPGCLAWSFFNAQLVLLSITLRFRLEFCCRNLNMYFDCCQGFTTSGPFILVRLFCCNLLQPVISVMLIHLLPLLLQKFFFFLNSLLHNSFVSYSIFLHIN